MNKHLEKTIEHCDRDHYKNAQYVSEFSADIMKHYMSKETINQPKAKNMNHQP